MGLNIPAEVIAGTGLTPEEFRIEIAVHLYEIGRMTLGQARHFADLDQISFQKEMAKRDVLIKYEAEDLEDDLAAIEAYKGTQDSPGF